jgi:hypothetical protein
MRPTVLAIAIGVAFVSACASVRTVSFPDPSVRTAYHRLLVVAITDDLSTRQRAEQAFAQEGHKDGVELVPASSVFIPGATYSDSTIAREMARRGIQGALFLWDATMVPPKVTTSSYSIPLCTLYSAYGCLQRTTIAGTSTNVQHPEYTIDERVMDMSSRQVVWSGSSKVTNPRNQSVGLLPPLAEDVTRTLLKDGVLQADSTK